MTLLGAIVASWSLLGALLLTILVVLLLMVRELKNYMLAQDERNQCLFESAIGQVQVVAEHAMRHLAAKNPIEKVEADSLELLRQVERDNLETAYLWAEEQQGKRNEGKEVETVDGRKIALGDGWEEL